MPEHSAWSTDPDDPDQDLSDLHFDPDTDDPVTTSGHTPPPPPVVSTEVVPFAEAASSPYDSDWLGDDDYDHDGNLYPPRKKSPSYLLRPSTNRRLARAYDRRRKVVEMRIAGHSFPDIAKALKFNSVEGARDAFNRAMLDVRDVAEEYRDLELARLEAITAVLWPMIETGDLEAIDKYMKIVSARIKITKMDQMALTGHGQDADGESNIERIGMVEDVQVFLAALPDLIRMTNQPAPLVINEQGEFVGKKPEATP